MAGGQVGSILANVSQLGFRCIAGPVFHRRWCPRKAEQVCGAYWLNHLPGRNTPFAARLWQSSGSGIRIVGART